VLCGGDFYVANIDRVIASDKQQNFSPTRSGYTCTCAPATNTLVTSEPYQVVKVIWRSPHRILRGSLDVSPLLAAMNLHFKQDLVSRPNDKALKRNPSILVEKQTNSQFLAIQSAESSEINAFYRKVITRLYVCYCHICLQGQPPCILSLSWPAGDAAPPLAASRR